MDATEFNPYNSRHLRPEMFTLPAIKKLSMKVVAFSAPKFRHVESYLEKYKQALEITIITEGPVPARAATPVLYIGNMKVSYYKAGKRENEYHYYAFDWQKLKNGTPIAWGWDNDPPEHIQQTKFYYEAPPAKKK